MRGMSPFSLGRQQGGRCQASVTSSPKEGEGECRQRGAATTVSVSLRQPWRRMHDNAWEGRAADWKGPYDGEAFVTF